MGACANIFGVVDLFDITTPAGCVVEESSYEETYDVDEAMNTDSQIGRACPKPWGKATARISGRGRITPATLTATEVAVGVQFTTSRMLKEKNDGEPNFDITEEKFLNNPYYAEA
jgi:hypothetical protein